MVVLQMSVYKGSAWQWNEKRRQFYLHQFLAEEPDLNYRNPLLREEMKVNYLTLAVIFGRLLADLSQDEPTASGPHDPRDYNYLNHTLTTNHPETLVVLREWRLVLDQYPNKVLMVSPTGENSESVMSYYGNSTHPLADIPLNSLLINSLTDRSHVTGPTLRSIIGLGLDKLPKGKWANWLLGNADQRRTATRVGTDLVDALNMMILLLPGTPVVYYGEEIGMEDTAITWNETRDSLGLRWGPDHYRDHSRDPARTPMQWDDTKLAGFTTSNSTWLPVNPNYKTLNVKGQSEAPQSHLKIFKELTVLRGQEAFRDGYLQFPVVTKNIFTFIRYVERADSYMLVINTSVDDVVVNLRLNSTVQLPQSGTVVLRSSSDTSADTLPGSEVLLDEVHLVAGEGLLLKLSLQSP
nr:probable maltase [Procambarus clarkii]